jgi:hypothetical protein
MIHSTDDYVDLESIKDTREACEAYVREWYNGLNETVLIYRVSMTPDEPVHVAGEPLCEPDKPAQQELFA